jgi:hypothetical protein
MTKELQQDGAQPLAGVVPLPALPLAHEAGLTHQPGERPAAMKKRQTRARHHVRRRR